MMMSVFLPLIEEGGRKRGEGEGGGRAGGGRRGRERVEGEGGG